MVARTIEVEPDSEVARLLHKAREQPIVLKLEGQRFQLRRETTAEEPENWTYDPQLVIQGMEEAKGAITPQEAEEWIQDVARRRREGAQQGGVHEPEGGYDADRFGETLRQVAGSISVEDGERIKAYIYAAREAGSRPGDKE
ncbi:MAG TPA: hypothetical protein VH482_06170 [Thermomicrobiales bacterium]|jgi:hypothetical protein